MVWAVMILRMDEAIPSPLPPSGDKGLRKSRWRPPTLAWYLILIGAVIALVSTALLRTVLDKPASSETGAGPASNGIPGIFPTATPAQSALIQRDMAGMPTVGPTEAAAAPEAPTATFPPPPEIVWTDAEKNVLSWLCRGEVGGMAEVKIDACLSVISTVRARYAYGSGFSETDVIGTISRPGQFTGIVWETDRPAPDPDLLWAVNQYQSGARGSCTGFLYFDSIPGGPVLCTITSSNGQFMEFHNGWN